MVSSIWSIREWSVERLELPLEGNKQKIPLNEVGGSPKGTPKALGLMRLRSLNRFPCLPRILLSGVVTTPPSFCHTIHSISFNTSPDVPNSHFLWQRNRFGGVKASPSRTESGRGFGVGRFAKPLKRTESGGALDLHRPITLPLHSQPLAPGNRKVHRSVIWKGLPCSRPKITLQSFPTKSSHEDLPGQEERPP